MSYLRRFGPTPAEAENLVEVRRLKMGGHRLGAVAIEQEKDEIVLTAAEKSHVDLQRMVNLLTEARRGPRVTRRDRIHAPASRGWLEKLLRATRRLLANVGAAWAGEP